MATALEIKLEWDKLVTNQRLNKGLNHKELGTLKLLLASIKDDYREEFAEITGGGRLYECYLWEINDKLSKPEPIVKPQPQPQPQPTPKPDDQQDHSDHGHSSDSDNTNTDTSTDTTPDNTRPPTPDNSEQEKPIDIEAQKSQERARYQTLENNLRTANNLKELEDGEYWDNQIDALDNQLLVPDYDKEELQHQRKEKREEVRWDIFFKNHRITEPGEKKDWTRNYQDAPTAEKVYKAAVLQDKEGKEWDPPLGVKEKEAIIYSKTDNAIDISRDNIKNERKWKAFFSKHDIKENYQKKWKDDYGVNQEAAENEYTQALKDWNPALTKEEAESIIKAPSLAKIKERQKQIPEERIQAKWDAFFKGKTDLINPDAWRFSGLTPDEAPTAWANGWKEVTGKEQNYNEEEVKVLLHKKGDIDTSTRLLKEIGEQNTFLDLATWEKANEEAIGKLEDKALPTSKQQAAVRARIETQRANLWLKLDEPKDGGLEAEQLAAARKLEAKKYVAKGKPAAPAEVINKVLAYEINKDRSVAKVEWSEPKNLDAWLTDPAQKGYRVEGEPAQEIKGKTYTGKELLDQEYNKWANKNHEEYDPGKQGRLLLPFFNKKVGFDIDKPEEFLCEALTQEEQAKVEELRKKKPEETTTEEKALLQKAAKGHLPYPTGSGKSTKVVACLCRGGSRNVVLVTPTKDLALSAIKHHTDWLQDDYICPIHEEKHGQYTTEPFKIGEKGLSILEPGDLYGYLAREEIEYTKDGIKGVGAATTNADLDEKIKQIKEGRMLRKVKPLIIFDEADETDPTYQALIDETIAKKNKDGTPTYQVIKMSATFPGVPWSITTSYPVRTRLITGLKDDDLIYRDGERKNVLIFIRTTESRTKGKERIEPLTKEQKALLKDYSYVIIDRSNAGAAEGITYGMPRGTIFFGDPRHGRGFTFYIQKAVLTNWQQTRRLGGGWNYGEPVDRRLTLADMGQERGRPGRREPGDADFLNNEIGSIKTKDDVGTSLARAILTGDLTELAKHYGSLAKEGINFIRTAVAWPDKFGLRPEEILVGLGVGGAGNKKYPLFEQKPKTTPPDADLWDRHMRIIRPSTMPKETASEILKLMIANIAKRKTKDNQFPDNLKVKIESPLIAQIGWSEDTKKNGANIEEVREVINGIIGEIIKNPSTNQYKDQALFDKVVKCHKLALDLKIEIIREETDEWVDKKDKSKGKKKKENLTLLINSGKVVTRRSSQTKRYQQDTISSDEKKKKTNNINGNDTDH